MIDTETARTKVFGRLKHLWINCNFSSKPIDLNCENKYN